MQYQSLNTVIQYINIPWYSIYRYDSICIGTLMYHNMAIYQYTYILSHLWYVIVCDTEDYILIQQHIYHMHLYFWGINFCVFFQKVNFVGTYFRGYYFSWLWRVHTVLFIPQVGVIMSFITSIRRYKRLAMERKRKIFYPFAVSVMKDKEIVHNIILIAPSSCSKL